MQFCISFIHCKEIIHTLVTYEHFSYDNKSLQYYASRETQAINDCLHVIMRFEGFRYDLAAILYIIFTF